MALKAVGRSRRSMNLASRSQNMQTAAGPHSIALRGGCMGDRQQTHRSGKHSHPWPGNENVSEPCKGRCSGGVISSYSTCSQKTAPAQSINASRVGQHPRQPSRPQHPRMKRLFLQQASN